MIILIEPQGREDEIKYDIEYQKITVTHNGIIDTFDFTEMPDGVLELYDDIAEKYLIETELDILPILHAEKTDGVLTVKILLSVPSTEQDQRLLFPEPMTLQEFNDLMVEIAERDKEVEPDGEDEVEGPEPN